MKSKFFLLAIGIVASVVVCVYSTGFGSQLVSNNKGVGVSEIAIKENGASGRVINSTNIEEVIKKSDVIYVYFYADWCKFCKIFFPKLEDATRNQNATVYKVDVDNNQELRKKYKVRQFPTVLKIEKGECVDRLSESSTPLNTIENFLNK